MATLGPLPGPVSSAVDAAATSGQRTRRLISPAVARAAAERGIPATELETLPGSGAGGRLLVVDLPATSAAAPRGAAAASPASTAGWGRGSGSDRNHATEVAGAHPRVPIVVPLDERHQVRARSAVEDMQASAQLTSAVEVDVTALLRRVQSCQGGSAPVNGDVRTLILPDLAAAIATTLMGHPTLNARIDVTAGTVTYRDCVDLGVVVSGPRGDTAALITDAGGLSVERLVHELATVRLLAMAGVQAADARADATFTLFDRPGAPILFETPPLPIGTAASLALGWVERRPLATPQPSGGYRIAWAGYLCLTYDHRLVDGADAARFLADLAFAFAGDASVSGAAA